MFFSLSKQYKHYTIPVKFSYFSSQNVLPDTRCAVSGRGGTGCGGPTLLMAASRTAASSAVVAAGFGGNGASDPMAPSTKRCMKLS